MMDLAYFQDRHKVEIEGLTKEMHEFGIFEGTFKNKYGAIKVTRL